jgi:Uma2 family endonuclease
MRANDLFRVGRAEYLSSEEHAAVKSEWVDGVVYSMAGASKLHVRTVTRLIALLAATAEQRNCLLGSSDLLVRTDSAYYYPDLVVSCDPDDDARIESRPCFIVEVQSPSTKRADRHEKRDAYCSLATMHDYWIVDPETKVVESWTRSPEGWVGNHHTATESLHVGCLDIDLTVSSIVGQ